VTLHLYHHGSSACAALALLAALWVIVPRPSVDAALYGKRGSRPVSHYGYVVNRYAADGFAQFEHDVAQFDDADFAREALESHFIVSRIVHVKSKWVAIAGALTLLAMALAGIALLSLNAWLSSRKVLRASPAITLRESV